MSQSIFEKVVQNLKQAARHNSNVMEKPEVILWPDPDRQWESVIHILQEKMRALLIYGDYNPEKKQGPAIWLKCMLAGVLPQADWPGTETPVIYLPGVSKQDFKNITKAGLMLQPLMEYQYTGTMWLQENGKEWTVAAFIQNAQSGFGLKMAQDNSTKEALLSALPGIFQEPGVFLNKTFVDAEFLLGTVYPNVIADILKWMSDGDAFEKCIAPEKFKVFREICKNRFEFEPDYSNIRDIALKLGSKRNAWSSVWQYFTNAPVKYPAIPDLLRLAKPDDLGKGLFAYPRDSWPQVNEMDESNLRNTLSDIKSTEKNKILTHLNALQLENQPRKSTVWYELGQAPLVDALDFLKEMAEVCFKTFPSKNLEELTEYYVSDGFRADQAMRRALAAVVSEADKNAIIEVISYIYKPWLENITLKFQDVLRVGYKPEIPLEKETGGLILFVDALRYELAAEFTERLNSSGFEVTLDHKYTAIPTLTPTSKPFNSPLQALIGKDSVCNEFRPQLKNGKDLTTPVFRDALQETNFQYVPNAAALDPETNSWMEIGEVDTKGHQEQSGMVRRIDELYRSFLETIEIAFSKGFKTISIVTDHGWLLLPGGLPKTNLSKHLTETRWGRCALIKDGATTDLPHLPWHWNPATYIAFAPGITFFKNNVEYAHGGLSLQECVVPVMQIKEKKSKVFKGKIAGINWNNLICKIDLEDASEGFWVDIRNKHTDVSSSIVISSAKKKFVAENKCSLMVDDSCEGMAAWVVLFNKEGLIVDKQMTSVGQ